MDNLENEEEKLSDGNKRGETTPATATQCEHEDCDVQSTSKQIPRGSRQRELPGNNGYKNDQNRKPAPQKSKAMDKRPRPRGGNNVSGKENSQINEDQLGVEFGSLLRGGSKKQNLNHLLSFHYEPRGDLGPSSRTYHHSSQYGTSTKALMATQAHKYNKEQFLQANCQFVVRAGVDYSPYMVDPDLLVTWDYIELIRVWSNQAVTCPICLYPPVAGKITRCGHIFCWPCVLHYLALSDKSWRKCPICYESVHKGDLKSVESISCSSFSVGQEITLQLMKREKGSLIATPVGQFESRKKPLLYISEKDLDIVYSKLLLAEYDDVLNLLKREQVELQAQIKESYGCPELCFVEEAMESLRVRLKSLEESKSDFNRTDGLGGSPQVSEVEEALPGKTSEDGMCKSPTEDGSKHDSCDSNVEFEPPNVRAEELMIESHDVHTTAQTTKYFYFYQAIDGQQVYLNALNVRMLEMTYTLLEHCPPTVKGTVLEKEAGSMTRELRRRLRYLEHVPITCQFEVVEICLKPPIVSEETVEAFQEQLDQRRRRRAKQAREERKLEKRIEESERRMFGHGPPAPNLKIESLQHFPQCGTADFPATISPPVRGESSENSTPCSSSRHSFSSSTAATLDDDHNGSDEAGPSFAQMLREGKSYTASSQGEWPSIGPGCSSSSNKAKPTWVTRESERCSDRRTDQDVDSETEHYIASPTASFNIAEALQNATISSGGKKKKKGKKILFST